MIPITESVNMERSPPPRMSNATSSSNPLPPLRCTCGTIPIIDLSSYDQQKKTDDVNQEGKKEDESWIESTRSSIVSACQSHGCFHLVINTNANNEDEEVIVKPTNHKKSSLSSLTHLSPSWEFASKNPNEVIGPLFDQKIEEMTQPQRLSTYRGRNAESGKVGSTLDNGDNEEPKQSWEFRRCHCTSLLKGEEDSTDSTLCQWTMALHSIAVRLSDILNLPNGMIVRNDDGDGCNSDLLRVFRYDPIDPQQPRQDDDENDIALGSSPHTDWGTMTIVWQDGIGGLQMYCHENDQWYPVVPPPSSSNDSKHQLHCFVHVGDFLSLSSPPVMSSCSNNRNGHDAVVVEPLWKSPRHRVVSPTGIKPRYSLVYFLYPRLGMTLRHAQTQMANNGDYFGATIHDDDPLPMNHRSYPSSVLERYSLLHNQSVVLEPFGGETDNDDSILQTRFQEMRHVPFEEVVAQKWAQVQRS
mmetsp:Transcript_2510/g.3799  ORF Transcript_2510/g.3799 Transcript_2510/m.3799 type:complete len:470 (+) Transcript_2510:3-1412(+)